MIVRPCREEELPLVLEMSDAWVEEGCCNGMERDDLEYLKQFEIFLALEDERPVGYAYGRARTAQKKTAARRKRANSFSTWRGFTSNPRSAIPVAARCFIKRWNKARRCTSAVRCS